MLFAIILVGCGSDPTNTINGPNVTIDPTENPESTVTVASPLPTPTPFLPTPTPIPISVGVLPDPFLLEHETPFLAVAFSPDGRYLATGDLNFYLNLWDRQSRKLIKQWQVTDRSDVTGGLEKIAFSPDGKYVTTCVWKNSLQVWQVETQRLVLEIPYKCYDALTYTQDGAYIVAASRADMVKAWNSETGEEVLSIPVTARNLEFSRDGSTCMFIDLSNMIHIWDWHESQEITSFKGGNLVYASAFSPDGTHVVTLDNQQVVSIFEAATGDLVNKITTPETEAPIIDMVFSPSGDYLFLIYLDGSVEISEFPTLEQMSDFDNLVQIYEVALSLDGSALALAGQTKDDGLVMIWEFGE